MNIVFLCKLVFGKNDTSPILHASANKIYLATDPDREGEAISWHLANALNLPIDETRRVSFNEITKTAVKAAIKSPRKIDVNLVDSQQARRILDRIVGYKLSPFLSVLLCALFLKEKINKKQIISIIIAFTGALLIIKPTFSI